MIIIVISTSALPSHQASLAIWRRCLVDEKDGHSSAVAAQFMLSDGDGADQGVVNINLQTNIRIYLYPKNNRKA